MAEKDIAFEKAKNLVIKPLDQASAVITINAVANPVDKVVTLRESVRNNIEFVVENTLWKNICSNMKDSICIAQDT